MAEWLVSVWQVGAFGLSLFSEWQVSGKKAATTHISSTVMPMANAAADSPLDR